MTAEGRAGVRRWRGGPSRWPARLSRSLFVASFVLVGGTTAHADIATATLAVSAQVLPHAALTSTDTADSAITIKAADLARGYVDVTRHYELRTNSPERVSLAVQPRLGFASAVDIAGLGSAVRLVDTTVELAAPSRQDFDLTFRVWLPHGLEAGDYRLPWHVAAVAR